jgi:hypothetical protein
MNHVTDERLAWLAVRDELERESRRLGLRGWLLAVLTGGGGGLPSASASRAGPTVGRARWRERTSERMGDYALAVDDVAQQLSDDERRVLRATGQVPDWFLEAVRDRYASLHR